jgi:hypothetical protein
MTVTPRGARHHVPARGASTPFRACSFAAPNMQPTTPGAIMRPDRSLAFCVLAMSLSAPGVVACGGQGSDEATQPQRDDASGLDVGTSSDGTSGGAMQEGEAAVATDSASLEAESVTDAGASDAGSLPCGDASCDSTQICLYPACGCAAVSGPCPAPSCVSPPTGAGSYDCSPGGVETPACSMVNVPIPSTCSRVCHGNCA